MNKHTPGPWEVGLKFPHNNRFVVRSNAEWDKRPLDARGLIANIVNGGNSKDVAEANAHLIAAAPELLAAAEEVLSWNEDKYAFGYEQLRAAVAKAKGEQ